MEVNPHPGNAAQSLEFRNVTTVMNRDFNHINPAALACIEFDVPA